MSTLKVGDGVTSFGNPPGGRPTQLCLYDTAGVAWFIWVDTSGVLRISDTASTEETDFAAGGTIVGAQTA